MNKKKILFIMPYLGCGGVETTFFSLLDNWDRASYDVTLLLLENKGSFKNRIPSDIRVQNIELPESEWGIFYGKKKILRQYLRKFQFWKIPKFISYNRKFSLSEDRSANAEYFIKIIDKIKPIKEEFDMAIDFFGYATFTTVFLAEKINAKIKVSWLHSVLSRFNPEPFACWYKKIDLFFACSQKVKEDFEILFDWAKNVNVFYNIINPKTIIEKSLLEGGFIDQFEGTRILTVGRICEEKGSDLALNAFKLLRNIGYKIRWYMIGPGDKEELEGQLSEEEKKDFIFLGLQNNPFVYMRQCDIYVQPSRFEGYCTTTNEARILCKPIIMTDVSGAREQIVDGVSGLIVEKNADAIFEAIKLLLNNPSLKDKFIFELKKLNCDTRDETKKLDILIQ